MHDSNGIVGSKPSGRRSVALPTAMRWLCLSACVGLLALALVGCGQKGPLYLPSAAAAASQS